MTSQNSLIVSSTSRFDPFVLPRASYELTMSQTQATSKSFPESTTRDISPNTIASTIGDSEFTPFPNLPAELRLHIWKSTLPAQRIIQLKFRGYHRDGDNTKGPGFYAPTRIPQALSICQESRSESLKQYTLAFSSVYINFQTDVLYIPGSILFSPPLSFGNSWQDVFQSLLGEFAKDLAKVKFLALHALDCNKLSHRSRPEPMGKYFLSLKKAIWFCFGEERLRRGGKDSVMKFREDPVDDIMAPLVELWKTSLGLDMKEGVMRERESDSDASDLF
jgi:hypothetical protein